MLSCKQTAELISRGVDGRLSFWVRMSLRLHLAMCRGCAAYRAQIEGLHAALRLRFGPTGRTPGKMPEETRRKIREALRRSGKGEGESRPVPGDPDSP